MRENRQSGSVGGARFYPSLRPQSSRMRVPFLVYGDFVSSLGSEARLARLSVDNRPGSEQDSPSDRFRNQIE